MTNIDPQRLVAVTGGGKIPRLNWSTLREGSGGIFTIERMKGGEQFLAKVVQDGKTYFTGTTHKGKNFVTDGEGNLLYGKQWK